ncbi:MULTISPECIES: NAD(P)H-dependent oxidoreductase [unclassified Streptomyces]|uniref:flavodoxin family protein n=1 Tax=unclassified Streptomyces TaxID=2593676 RepID=UPI0006FB1906|nr:MULTISPECIES: NAD(P)H-dependent oxidoreductase [unclassified Streptomyces]KQX58047.1 flavodoxin [Streptomyces sp. Root1304]KRA95369.1 flavodoxin [Streptomyces sp. Root66D1]
MTLETASGSPRANGSNGPARSFLFVLGSSRADGNTEILARAAAAQLPADVPQRWVDLNRLPLPDFQDGRHETDGWPADETEELLREATLEATDIVIASPLYWYTLSAQTKRYLDYWSGWLNVPDSDFKERMAGRTLWGVTAMAHEEHEVADGLTTALHHSAAYLGMHFGGVLTGTASRPGRIRADEQALLHAKTFFAGATPLARFPYEEGAGAVA